MKLSDAVRLLRKCTRLDVQDRPNSKQVTFFDPVKGSIVATGRVSRIAQISVLDKGSIEPFKVFKRAEARQLCNLGKVIK